MILVCCSSSFSLTLSLSLSFHRNKTKCFDMKTTRSFHLKQTSDFLVSHFCFVLFLSSTPLSLLLQCCCCASYMQIEQHFLCISLFLTEVRYRILLHSVCLLVQTTLRKRYAKEKCQSKCRFQHALTIFKSYIVYICLSKSRTITVVTTAMPCISNTLFNS